MLQTDQPMPSLGSQTGTVETNPDGSTDVYIGPTAPDGKQPMQAKRGTPAIGRVENLDVRPWLQTVPAKASSPPCASTTTPEFFDKFWRPSESNRWANKQRPGRLSDLLEAPVWLMAEWPDREG